MHPTDVQPPEAVQSIPLDCLELSPANVRKTDPGLQAFAELKASIAAHGLLSNLVVRRALNGPDRFAVVAGGRRYAALRDLASEDQIPADMPIPCRVVAIDAPETEISLAENVIRAPMHPADQVEAFAVLAQSGTSVAAIAARFGVAERTVEQRLRLGNAAPQLLQAYRDDELDLECLKAFAITTDHTRQTATWKQISEQGYRPSAWQIKRMLTENRVPAAAAIAGFVGVEAYEAAGGQVDRDLFASDDDSGVWFEDPRILDKLAMKRLQATAHELATAWKWSEARLEADWNTLAVYGRVQPIPAEPTPEEAAEQDKLRNRQHDLADLDEDTWTEELFIEAEACEQRLDEIEAQIEARSTYAPGDMKIAGCVVTIGREGDTHIVSGLVRREDIPSAKPAAGSSGDDASSEANPGGRAIQPPSTSMHTLPGDRAAQARKEAGVGIGLADDLRSIRTTLVKVGLAADYDAAFDVFVFHAARSIFTNGYVTTSLDIAIRETADRPHLRINDDNFGAENPGEANLDDRSNLTLDWMEIEDDGASFTALRALPQTDKQALFAACIARTVKGQLAFEHGARPELEATVARLEVDFAAKIRPSADMFWSRIKKADILDIARRTLGIEWAAGHSKDKKAVLASAMERAFGVSDDIPAGVTPEGRAAALAWIPQGFAAFDTPAPQSGSASDTPPEPDTTTAPTDHPQEVTDPPPQPSDPPDAPADPAPVTGPRVIIDVNPAGTPDEVDQADQVDPAIAAAAAATNGHDVAGEAFDIPAFLRRT